MPIIDISAFGSVPCLVYSYETVCGQKSIFFETFGGSVRRKVTREKVRAKDVTTKKGGIIS